jgi:2-methylcitrate dehydratase PrpD
MTMLIETLGGFAADMKSRTLAPEVMHHAKRVLIDWYAATFPGAVISPSVELERALAEDLDRGTSNLLLGRKATTRTAALINGSAAHAAEFDDIFKDGIYHPGAPTISAALAVAQSVNASGEALLRAIITGYELSTRIGAAMGRAHYKYWHNTGTIGVFGATPAAGYLYGLTNRQHQHAIATVTTFSAALQQAFRMDSHSKPLHSGRAAEAGALAAMAAREGVIGSLDVIDGKDGFGVAMGDGPDWTAAMRTLGTEWNVTRMTVKNHGCCGHTFAGIDGAQAVQASLGVRPEAIERVRVATYRAGVEVSGIERPKTDAEARFSMKYVVATALVHGDVRINAFEHDRLSCPITRALMERIDVVLDPELDATFPKQRAARVTITTKDGRSETYLQPHRKGDPEGALTDSELEAKYLELASPIIGASAAKALVARLWRIETEPNLAFTRELRKA